MNPMKLTLAKLYVTALLLLFVLAATAPFAFAQRPAGVHIDWTIVLSARSYDNMTPIGNSDYEVQNTLELANRQLLQAPLASVGELASGIAHEINNPIGIILGRSDYILVTQPDLSVEAKADLKVVRSQATESVASTVRSLLTFARPSLLSIQCVDLAQLVDQVIALEAPAAIVAASRSSGPLRAVSSPSGEIPPGCSRFSST